MSFQGTISLTERPAEPSLTLQPHGKLARSGFPQNTGADHGDG